MALRQRRRRYRAYFTVNGLRVRPPPCLQRSRPLRRAERPLDCLHDLRHIAVTSFVGAGKPENESGRHVPHLWSDPGALIRTSDSKRSGQMLARLEPTNSADRSAFRAPPTRPAPCDSGFPSEAQRTQHLARFHRVRPNKPVDEAQVVYRIAPD